MSPERRFCLFLAVVVLVAAGLYLALAWTRWEHRPSCGFGTDACGSISNAPGS